MGIVKFCTLKSRSPFSKYYFRRWFNLPILRCLYSPSSPSRTWPPQTRYTSALLPRYCTFNVKYTCTMYTWCGSNLMVVHHSLRDFNEEKRMQNTPAMVILYNLSSSAVIISLETIVPCTLYVNVNICVTRG